MRGLMLRHHYHRTSPSTRTHSMAARNHTSPKNNLGKKL